MKEVLTQHKLRKYLATSTFYLFIFLEISAPVLIHRDKWRLSIVRSSDSEVHEGKGLKWISASLSFLDNYFVFRRSDQIRSTQRHTVDCGGVDPAISLRTSQRLP
jgi:hypothetical protein